MFPVISVVRLEKPHSPLIRSAALVCGLLCHSAVQAAEFTELDCLIKPGKYIDVSSPVFGVLESVFVGKSDRVESGQILAQLESVVERARVDIAQHEADMSNQISAKQTKLGYAQRKLDRIKGLLSDSAMSSQELDDAETQVSVARSELLQTRLDQKRNQLRLLQAEAELDRKTIRSPASGVVVERYLEAGESVADKSILQIAQIDPLVVEVVAPYELFGTIDTGMEVTVFPDLPVGSSFVAQVSVVDNMIDAASGSFSIRMQVANPDNRLVAGSRCSARFPVAVKRR